MTVNEFNSFYALLSAAYPAEKRFKEAATKRMWQLALEPYDFKECHNALLECVRKNKGFIDPADVVSKIKVEDTRSHYTNEDIIKIIRGEAQIKGWYMPEFTRGKDALEWAKTMRRVSE